jgi:chromosome segregation ATPase
LPDADPADSLELVAERALGAYRGAQEEIASLRAAEAEGRARLSKTLKHAKRAIAAYHRSQEKLEAAEADLAESERDLAAAEAARASAEQRAVAAEQRADSAEAALAEIRRDVVKRKAVRKIDRRLRKLSSRPKRRAA